MGLKWTEKTTDNLCDICGKHFTTCNAEPNSLKFGNGVGNDNIICCGGYKPVEKECK
jgi:hypothetical protein